MVISPPVQVCSIIRLLSALLSILNLRLDMFGFKIEVPKREGSLKDKTRPIYLDMQVCRSAVSSS